MQFHTKLFEVHFSVAETSNGIKTTMLLVKKSQSSILASHEFTLL